MKLSRNTPIFSTIKTTLIELLDHQKKAIKELRTGSILWGGVGSGKTITSLVYFKTIECKTDPRDLYVITTAKKRDSMDWEEEAASLSITWNKEISFKGISITVDSWNNIAKYRNVEGAFFIFDEQKAIGSGVWVKSFLKIASHNKWIMLTATPGDTWMDYIPVFIANGFYRNRTEFIREHVVYNTFTKFPKVDRYINTKKLDRLKRKILVVMDYKKKTVRHNIDFVFPYDDKKFDIVYEDRWNPYKNRPIQNFTEACYVMRQIVNSHYSRFDALVELIHDHPKIIVFYNFDYELDILRRLEDVLKIPVAEYNGHFHEELPEGRSWIYLAQYQSLSEAWNCVETNVIVFYSLTYSYKTLVQSSGRIDRMNSPFVNLYYYYFQSESKIDVAIRKALKEKKNFNERKFFKMEVK